MTAALLILVVMVAVARLLNPSREQFAWFIRLRRPAWLTFEGLIPLIWLTIYACFYASALLSWNASWSVGLMAGYLVLLLLVQSHTWLICRTRRLSSGTVVGFAGWVWGVALTIVVAPGSAAAAGAPKRDQIPNSPRRPETTLLISASVICPASSNCSARAILALAS